MYPRFLMRQTTDRHMLFSEKLAVRSTSLKGEG